MKPRRWVLHVTLVLLALVLAGLGLWHGLDMEERLRGRFVAGLERLGLHDVQLERIRPRLMGLELRGLGFATADTVFTFDCRRALVSFTPLSWLFHPRQPLSIIESLRLEQPCVRWDAGRGLRDRARPSFLADSVLHAELKELLDTAPRVTISDGSFLVAAAGRELPLLNHLDGLLWRGATSLELLVESDLPSGAVPPPGHGTQRGMEFRLELEPVTLDGRFTLDLKHLELGSQLLPQLEDHISGRLQARAGLQGSLKAGQLDSLAGGGELLIEGARLSGLDSLLDFRATLEVGTDRLNLVGAEITLAGQRLAGEGWVDREWHLDWLLSNLRPERIEDLLPGSASLPPLQGRLDMVAELRGVLARPRLAAIAEGHVGLPGLVCDTLEARFTAGPDSLRVDHLLLAGPRGRLEGRGAVSDWLGDSRTVLDWNVTLPLTGFGIPGLPLDPGQQVVLAGVLHNDAAGPRVEFNGTVGTRPVALHVSGRWEDERLACRFLDASTRSVGGLELVTHAGLATLQLDLEDVLQPLAILLAGKAPWPADSRMGLELNRMGEQWLVDLDLALPTLATRLSGGLSTAVPGELAFTGNLSGRSRWGDRLDGTLAARLRGSRLELDSLRLLNSLVLSGSLDPRTRQYRAQLDSGPVPLGTLLNLLPRTAAAPPGGLVTLLLAGEGSLDEPGLRGAIEYSLILPDSSRLNWWSPLELSRHWVQAPGGRLRLGLTDLASTEIGFATDLSSGSGQLWLAELELANLLPHNPLRLAGHLSGQARLKLEQGRPRLMLAELDLDHPSVSGLVFDRLNLRAAQRSEPDEDGRPVIQLDSLVLHRNGSQPLELRVEGQLPVDRTGEMDLTATLRGDLFQLVTNDTTFIRSGRGRTDGQVRITGTPESPLVLDGSLTLAGGELDLESVMPRLRDINLDLRLVDGALEIRRFEARSGRGSLRIRNRAGWVTPEGEELQPWQLFGTNLGVLVVEMGDSEHHLDTVIPGLMELGWNAEVRLRGRVPGEDFVLAGPLERPVIRGTVDVRNARFTFPFIVSNREPTPILLATVDFLNTIDWDLQVVPGRNCNYYKEIQGFEDVAFFDSFQGYLDRITVDVYLDRDRDPMLFSGQIDDETFRIVGTTTSSRGDIKYLFLNFQVDELGMEFDATSLLPVVWGTADYYVYESGGNALPGQLDLGANSRTFFLKLVVEDEFGNLLERGRWSVISLKLEDEQGRAVEQFLPELGIDPLDPLASFQSVLPGVVAGFLPLPLTPVESRIRRALGLDLVRISLPVLQNTAEDLLGAQKDTRDSYWNYLQGTRVTAGKELGPKYFLSWTGQLLSSSGLEVKQNMNLYQLFSLEYSVNRDLSLTGDLVFDPLNENSSFKGDPRVFLRYRVDY